MKVTEGTERRRLVTDVTPEVKERFAEIARRNSRSVSGEIRFLIERQVERDARAKARAMESAA